MGDAMEALARLAIPIAIVALLLIAAFRRPLKDARLESDGPEDEVYRVYTRDFDLEAPARDVLEKLADASPDEAKGWLKGPPLDSLQPQLESMLVQQRAALASDRGEVVAALRDAAGGVDPTDIVVAMLVDQSGSMKDERIMSAAVATTLMVELLDEMGTRSEVLSFSTAGWQGGHARVKWRKDGKPRRPGRVAALMHIIYKSADDPQLDEEARRVMVHPDLLRENIDGEAILWAWERLAARPEPRKILMVLSDGAPVDDSTLMQNGRSYLWRHLKAVLRQLAAEPNLVLGGVGIEHRVESLYPSSETVETLEDLPRACIRLSEKLLAASCEATKAG